MATRIVNPTNGTNDWPTAANTYLAAVQDALGGIDDEERQDLVEDLRTHIAAMLQDKGEGVDLVDRLGPPEVFAAELLEAAGLDTPRRPDRVVAWKGRTHAYLADPRAERIIDWLRQLHPAWWVARGYGVALFLSSFTGGSSLGRQLPIPWILGNPVTGLVTTGGLIYLSVEIGAGRLDISGGWRLLATKIASFVAAVTLLFFGATAANSAPTDLVQVGPGQYVVDDGYAAEMVVSQKQPDALTLPGHDPVTNIYAFDTDGTPLKEVLLYDGVGNPLVLQDVPDGRGYPFDIYGLETDYERDADGNLVSNLFPLTQYRSSDGIEGPLDDPSLPGDLRPLRPSVDERRRPVPQVVIPALPPQPSTAATPAPTRTPGPTSPDE